MWAKPTGELFTLALKNSRRLSQPREFSVTLPNGQIHVLIGDEFFSADEALWLDRHPDCLGKYGALVGIPTTQIVLCYPIRES